MRKTLSKVKVPKSVTVKLITPSSINFNQEIQRYSKAFISEPYYDSQKGRSSLPYKIYSEAQKNWITKLKKSSLHGDLKLNYAIDSAQSAWGHGKEIIMKI